jgi:hypothetical protein
LKLKLKFRFRFELADSFFPGELDCLTGCPMLLICLAVDILLYRKKVAETR